ncbi:hypothetical protein FF1_000941 [Malus domestica]
MTKKLTHFEPQFATELDLDSFLNSHVSLSDEDYDDDHISSVTHRTIDEILNDTDSSASSSPPSPWFSRRHENKCEARGGPGCGCGGLEVDADSARHRDQVEEERREWSYPEGS